MNDVESELARRLALDTRKHCFITGKAGTGKTTLLKLLAQKTQKKLAIVAPTGIAAINAGGMTLHALFGLPPACFIPNNDAIDPNLAVNRQALVSNHLRLTNARRNVLRELELLIIDEVSMVRADIFDTIDFVLRTVRRDRQPFGGVQVVLFGDVHQLPPVAREQEWNILKRYYRSAHFFDSMVWPQLHAARIVLQTTRRQNDARFLQLLDNVRHCDLPPDDQRLLRERYQPNFKPGPEYVVLSTHNHKADSTNSAELEQLPGKTFDFTAEINNDFPESMYPCDELLQLKAGAQVMFIRNDTDSDKYYNGKLATVKHVDATGITVTFKDSGTDYALHREVWEKIEYRVAKDTEQVTQHVVGSFSQYPLRLAWAITIHKSQGLTFDKVVIDAGRSFAPGQVYVALSRCRSLEGIVLHSLITPDALPKDKRLNEFGASHHTTSELEREYACALLSQVFSLTDLQRILDEWPGLIESTQLPDKPNTTALCQQLMVKAEEIRTTAVKFQRKLSRLSAEAKSNTDVAPDLREESAKAIAYFTAEIATQLVKPLIEHLDALAYKSTIKPYLDQLRLIEAGYWDMIEALYGARWLDVPLYQGTAQHIRPKTATSARPSGVAAKADTFQATLDLHRQGKSAAEIATLRGLKVGTIKSHFMRWIETGDVDIHELVPASTVTTILAFVHQNRGANLSDIRSGTGDQFEYDDIRMVIAHDSRGSA